MQRKDLALSRKEQERLVAATQDQSEALHQQMMIQTISAQIAIHNVRAESARAARARASGARYLAKQAGQNMDPREIDDKSQGRIELVEAENSVLNQLNLSNEP